MQNPLPIQNGDNWTVLVFHCPITNSDKILIEIFDMFDQNTPLVSLPHYMVRGKDSLSDVVVSLRMFRKSKAESSIKNLLENILRKFGVTEIYSFNSQKVSDYYKYHNWIKNGEININWEYDQCEVLHDLSRICISLMKKNLFFHSERNCSREHAIHLFIWMMGLREYQRDYWEYLLENQPPVLMKKS
ncbi:MAG: hypothetical protein ACFFB5_23905 [Promethearchaeota archaeon]